MLHSYKQWMRAPISSTFAFISLFYYSHLSACKVVAHCSFDFHLPNQWWCQTSFHVLIGHLYVFLGKMSIQILCLLFNWVVVLLLLHCKSSLSFIRYMICKYFLLFYELCLDFLSGTLYCTKAFNFDDVQFIYFSFWCLAFSITPKKPLCNPKSWKFGGLPGDASGKESSCQCRRHKRHSFDLWVGKIPWSRKWQPVPVFLPGKFQGQRSLTSYSPWGLQSQTWLNTHMHTHENLCLWFFLSIF